MKKLFYVVLILLAVVLSLTACEKKEDVPTTHIHEFEEWSVSKEATCSEHGIKVRFCDCGEKQSETIRMRDHSYSERILTPHTIDNKGEMIYECANCNYSYTMPIGHTYNLTEMVNPTCYEDGYSIYSCDCGSFYEANFTETSGHVMGSKEYYINNSNTNACEWTNPWFSKCTACGFVEYGEDGATGHDFVDGRCTRCGKVDPQGDDVHRHTFGEWQKAENGTGVPDCEIDCIYNRLCSSCGFEEIKIEPPTGHAYVDGSCTICGGVDPDFDPGYSVGLEYTPIDDNTCYVSGIGKCPDTDLVIPSVAPDGKTVVAIGENAFHCPITSVIIPDSVKTIGPSAFSACISLVYVDIGNGVEYIAAGAFRTCTQLKSIVIGKSILGILERAFEDCNSLTNVYYKGSEEEWEEIWIYVADDSNQDIFNATRYYYSETAPTTEGNFWHYVDGVPTVW